MANTITTLDTALEAGIEATDTARAAFDTATMRLGELVALTALLADDDTTIAIGNLNPIERTTLFSLVERLARDSRKSLLQSLEASHV
ncbi:hypothetical protein [Paraburkholderia sp. Cpub6]|uniref:hypothetical protein n=1 Tax=Paraburkholderia sp. Cpub6 TaxID=2723094 RepID=UPI0016086A17|nr:hypothetical protein [Paraburkholderia sp. Cpub6]MBB5458691.1 hypothetical protein [Paraburkholderia sp. Cpub6]